MIFLKSIFELKMYLNDIFKKQLFFTSTYKNYQKSSKNINLIFF